MAGPAGDGSRRSRRTSRTGAGRQAARRELSSALRPRAGPRMAGTRPRQHRRHPAFEGVGGIRPRRDRGRAGAVAALYRLRRFRPGAELLPPPRRGGVSRRLGGDRRGARSRRHGGGIRRPATRHSVLPLHAGDNHRQPLAHRRTAGLCRRARAGTRHGHRPVLRAAARRATRRLPAHRHRIRPGHRPHRPARASAGPGALRRLHPQSSVRRLRPRHRESAVLRPCGAGSRHPRLAAKAA